MPLLEISLGSRIRLRSLEKYGLVWFGKESTACLKPPGAGIQLPTDGLVNRLKRPNRLPFAEVGEGRQPLAGPAGCDEPTELTPTCFLVDLVSLFSCSP